MAINENKKRSAAHACITCATGNGKGVALSYLGVIPDKSCCIIFDPYGEWDKKLGKRPIHQYRTRRGFARAFANAWQSGKPFVLSYFPQSDKNRTQEMLWFGDLAWAASDGNKTLYTVFEEYGKCTTSVGKDETIVGEIFSGGRKFGLRAVAIFQRSAEIPKTIWANAPIKVIGAQENINDIKRIQEQLDCDKQTITEIGLLNVKFSMFVPEWDETVKVKTHYLVSKGFGHFDKKASIVEPCRHLMKKWPQEIKQLHNSSQYELINP